MTDSDVAALRREFSDWGITVSTTTANSGPEVFTLVAKRGAEKVIAFSVRSLKNQLLMHDRNVS